MKITIGKTLDGRKIGFDLDTLLTSRLLIQANSGAGKSYIGRRLMEQLFGHVQVIAIDPEGEFATLREQFGYVLVGKGGETPADVRSAGMVAEKLLEVRASAVCDLYEMKRNDRHVWVEKFLNALVDAPKKLWHPTIVLIDEAHVFCPEKGQGESVASGSVIDLVTRGRKRGFCPVLLTQRLSKLDKSASAELLNRLVGGTFEDVDIKRAINLLSIASEDVREFSASLRTLEPGYFYALGRAISKERVLFKVDPVVTSHPQPGSAKHAAEPPPTPDQVKTLLPKLGDLPKAAEEKARTEAELRREIRELKNQIAAAARASAKPAAPVVDEDAVNKAVIAAVTDAVKRRDDAWHATVNEQLSAIGLDLQGIARRLHAIANIKFDKPVPVHIIANRPKAEARTIERTQSLAATSVKGGRGESPLARAGTDRPSSVPFDASSNGHLSSAHIRVLSRLAEIQRATGRESIPKNQLAAWSDYSPNSGGYNNILGKLRSGGYIDYPQPGTVALTEQGQGAAQPGDAPISTEEMLSHAKGVLGGSEARILEAVHRAYPEAIDKLSLAEATGFAPNSGGYNNYLGHMRTLGFIDYPQPGKVRAEDWLFLEGVA